VEEGNRKCEVVSVLATTGASVETICHPGVGGQQGGEAGAGQEGGGGQRGGTEGQAGLHELTGHHASQLQGLVLCRECSQKLQC
jgi:hypothetical protein